MPPIPAIRRAALAAALALACALAAAAPFTPASDDQIVERLPGGATDPSVRRVDSLRKQLAARPGDAGLRLEIAHRYFDLAMAQGDPRYVGYASAALAPLAQGSAGDAQYWLLSGLLQQYGHDFAGALRSLRRSSELDPRAAEPVAWRAAIDMVLARYPDALAECTRLVALADALQAQGCTAYVQASTGHLEAAYGALSRELAAAAAPDAALVLWVRTRLAEWAIRLQRPDQAQGHFEQALRLGITDQYLLAAYADFLLEQHRAEPVLALLADWERSDVLLLRLALAGKMARDPRAPGWAGQLRDRFAAAARRGDRLHEQEAARFALDIEGQPAKALELAARNYTAQKEARDAAILMRSALAAGRPQAARPALDWMRAANYEDHALAALAAQLAAQGANR